jgi:hypothetical protein
MGIAMIDPVRAVLAMGGSGKGLDLYVHQPRRQMPTVRALGIATLLDRLE